MASTYHVVSIIVYKRNFENNCVRKSHFFQGNIKVNRKERKENRCQISATGAILKFNLLCIIPICTKKSSKTFAII